MRCSSSTSARVRVLSVGVVDELCEVPVCEDLVNVIVILWNVEQVGLITCVSVAIGARSSLRVTVVQGVLLGGAEEDVFERGECQDVEIGVEDVEEKQHRVHDWKVMMEFSSSRNT